MSIKQKEHTDIVIDLDNSSINIDSNSGLGSEPITADTLSIFNAFTRLEGLRQSRQVVKEVGGLALDSITEEINSTADEIRFYRQTFGEDYHRARSLFVTQRDRSTEMKEEQQLDPASPINHEVLHEVGLEPVEQAKLRLNFGDAEKSDIDTSSFPRFTPIEVLERQKEEVEATATLIRLAEEPDKEFYFVDLKSAVSSLNKFSAKQIDKHGAATKADHERGIANKLLSFVSTGQILGEQSIQSRQLSGLRYIRITTSSNHTRFYYFHGPEINGKPSIISVGECNKNAEGNFYSLITKETINGF